MGESDPDLHTGSTLCVDTPVYTELLPTPLLTQGQWDSTSAHHPHCPQVTEECWGTFYPPTAFLWVFPNLGAVIALRSGHTFYALPRKPVSAPTAETHP